MKACHFQLLQYLPLARAHKEVPDCLVPSLFHCTSVLGGRSGKYESGWKCSQKIEMKKVNTVYQDLFNFFNINLNQRSFFCPETRWRITVGWPCQQELREFLRLSLTKFGGFTPSNVVSINLSVMLLFLYQIRSLFILFSYSFSALRQQELREFLRLSLTKLRVFLLYQIRSVNFFSYAHFIALLT